MSHGVWILKLVTILVGSVREFFRQYSEIATVVHGVLTPSVAHEPVYN